MKHRLSTSVALSAAAAAALGLVAVMVFRLPRHEAPTANPPSTDHTDVDDPSPSNRSSTSASAPPVTEAAGTSATAHGAATTGAPEPAEVSPIESDDRYRWIWAQPEAIRMVWRDAAQRPYGQLQRARRALEEQGNTVVAITNGGGFSKDNEPLGLFVENGVEQVGINRARGNGNFFLQPNGVFWVGDRRAAVETTEAFMAHYGGSDGPTVDWAVQSGPMLVVDGAINPLFTETSTSVHIRNAVAVDPVGRVLLIRSHGPVTMWELAARCLALGAVDVLYLDGTISRLDPVRQGRPLIPNIPVASMIAVVE
jgi:uncharacterized protein YigE (DUF2233 family)